MTILYIWELELQNQDQFIDVMKRRKDFCFFCHSNNG